MIAGIGTDIAEVKRFEKWVKNPEMLERFFHEKELSSAKDLIEAAGQALDEAIDRGSNHYRMYEINRY